MKEEKIQAEWVIIETLPGTEYQVQLSEEFGNMVIRAYVGGKMRRNYISLIKWDTVLVELTPYDLEKGRIIFRWKK